MSPSFQYALVLASCLGSTMAQDAGFGWIWPPPFGLDPTTMNVAPCGGFNATATNVTNFLDQLRWNQTEQKLNFMARVATNINRNDAIVAGMETPDEWAQISAVQAVLDDENGKPNPADPPQFCVNVDPPGGFNLNRTIFQLIADTPAGIIFACSRITFQPTTPGGASYLKRCDTNSVERGNGSIADTTVPALVSAASLRIGATATAAPSSTSTSAVESATSTPTAAPSGSELSKGEMAGIVVGSVVGGLLIIAAILFALLRMRRKKSASDKSAEAARHEASLSKSSLSSGVDKGPGSVSTVPSPNGHRDLVGDASFPKEIAGDFVYPKEMGGDTYYRSEMHGDTHHPQELAGDSTRAEMAHDPVVRGSMEKETKASGHTRVPSPDRSELVSPISDNGHRPWQSVSDAHSPVSATNSPDLTRASPKKA